MNFETLETIRTEAITATLAALVEIVKDKEADVTVRLKAAKQIDNISDTLVHAYLVSNATKEQSSQVNKLSNSINKLRDKHDAEE